MRTRLSDPRAPLVALGLVMALATGLLFWEMRGQTLAFDEWSFLAEYRGRSLSVVASPFGDNLLLFPILLYKAVFAVFGPGSVVLKLVVIALNLLCAGLFFALARRRVDDWIAVAGASLLIVFGASTDIVAQTLGIAILMTIAGGLGALLALERGGRFSDLAAAILLTIALGSNSVALPFLAAAAVHVLLASDRPWRPRIWLAGAPAVLYGAWRLWALGEEPVGTLASHPFSLTLDELGSLGASLAESLADALNSITGLFVTPSDPGLTQDVFGPGLAILLCVGIAVAVRSGHGPVLRPRAFVILVMPLLFWLLIGIAGSDRLPQAPRYQYPGAIFLMLALAELFREVQVPQRIRLAVIAVLVAGMLGNVSALHDRSAFTRGQSELNRAALTSVELARDVMPPDQLIEPFAARVDRSAPGLFSGSKVSPESDMLIPAGRYLSSVYAFGSVAFSEQELAAASPLARSYADRESAVALGVGLMPVSSSLPEQDERASIRENVRRCRAFTAPPLEPGAADLPVSDGMIVATPAGEGEGVTVRLRRFADDPAVELPRLASGAAARLVIPADRSARPWIAHLEYDRALTVCGGLP